MLDRQLTLLCSQQFDTFDKATHANPFAWGDSRIEYDSGKFLEIELLPNGKYGWVMPEL